MREQRPAILTGTLLLLAGFAAYLPVNIISGRYTMPAAWGLDILVGVLLTALLRAPRTALTNLAWVGIAAGLAAVMVSLVGKEEKFATRANVLWDAVQYVEQNAPQGSRIAWIDGDPLKGELDTEEGIHLRWHLLHRGRGDITVGFFRPDGTRIDRIELPPLDGEPTFRVSNLTVAPGWAPEQEFARTFWFGRKRYAFRLDRLKPGSTMTAGQNLMFTDICKRELLGEPPAAPEVGPSSLDFFFPEASPK